MNVRQQLEESGITPNVLLDQFFLIDTDLIHRLVGFANLNKKDTVLEIGAGIGNLTSLLAKKAGKVIAFEIDERFKPQLQALPNNVELHFESAREYIQLNGKWKKKKKYNKIVSNIPYSFSEMFMHNLTFLDYDKVILLVPLKFVDKINTNPVFGSFFHAEVKEIVTKD